jgi:hypothetical protein
LKRQVLILWKTLTGALSKDQEKIEALQTVNAAVGEAG